jgi:hypothetical protein
MIDTDFHRIRRKDFYADQERDESIEGRMYWCIEKLHICQDVYRPFNYPLRGMSAIDVGHLQKKPYFDEALHVIERMGLTQLLSIHCDYHMELILQFNSSLVMMNDDDHTLKSMSGANQCTATFRDFADALGFEFDGPNALGAHFLTPKGQTRILYKSCTPPPGRWALSPGCFLSMISCCVYSGTLLLQEEVTMMLFGPP